MSTQSKPLVWLITGCSSGFGLSLSLIALKNGHKVIATSRNPSKTPDLVKQVEDLGGLWLAMDITGPKEDMQKAVEEGTKHFGRIDVLVNNAGLAILGAVEDFSDQETNTIISTNFIGPLNLIQIITPQFRAQKSGIIVNISSGGAISPSPSMAIYGASKAALETLSLGLTKELCAFNIRVLIVQPGAFTTNMGNAIALTSQKTLAYKDTIIGQFTSLFADEKRDANGVATAYSSPNDVDKGCQGIFESVTRTGRGEGKEGFERLILSADIAQRQKDMFEVTMKGYEAFRPIWESTGHDGGVRK